jgi:uncharacterized protein (UPF0261 family)
MRRTILLILTLDTKAEEALFLREEILARGLGTLLMDVGVFPAPSLEGDVRRAEVAAAAGKDIEALIRDGDKGAAIETMIRGAALLTRSLYEAGKIHGVLSVGGAQGTIIGTTAMKTLPVGVPKLMVSTVASGKRDFGTYVGTSDVTMMHSVVDFFGFNTILRQVLGNAAGAVAGMVAARKRPGRPRPRVAITIYGTTTPAGMAIVALLRKAGYEAVAFHPNGTGGMAMERMIREGLFAGVIDLTTHELADELVGGGHACGPGRLEAASDMGIPQVIVPGSIDYLIQGRPETLRPTFRRRRTMMHNPEMTFVRTSTREMEALGRIIAEKASRSRGYTLVMIPEKGFSYPNHRGRAFYHPAGCRAFSRALRAHIDPRIPVLALPFHVNDPPFAETVATQFLNLMDRFKEAGKPTRTKGETHGY